MNTIVRQDESRPDFIDDGLFVNLLNGGEPGLSRVRDVVAKALSKRPLSVCETAELLLARDEKSLQEIFDAARELKERVYGNRIVIFAPLYIGNRCVNDCSYCAFKRSNADMKRRELSADEIRQEVVELVNRGHKRLILVFSEHPRYDGEFIADAIETTYSTKVKGGEIRRVNINAAPTSIEEYRTIKSSGIGTYQIFQETYNRRAYARVHPAGTPKADYIYRLHGLSRAMEAGIDDVGIGALFGLHDWRYEVLGLVSHANYLRDEYGVGPHTVSFPRIKHAHGVVADARHRVSDDEFRRVVAILRLAIPYTGMILTARETPAMRRELLGFGVTQIDAGSRIELGGYSGDLDGKAQDETREQFMLGDLRSLDEIVLDLMRSGNVPSFCTACYRSGRTGEVFMEYAIPGFIKEYCTPNALITLMEYLSDYASEETLREGQAFIREELEAMGDAKLKEKALSMIARVGCLRERDLFF